MTCVIDSVEKKSSIYLWRAVLVSAFLTFTSAPFRTNNFTICKFPFTVATYKDVSLFDLSALMSAPFCRHTSPVLRSFVPAARCRTVLLFMSRSSTSSVIFCLLSVAEINTISMEWLAYRWLPSIFSISFWHLKSLSVCDYIAAVKNFELILGWEYSFVIKKKIGWFIPINGKNKGFKTFFVHWPF